MKTRGEEQRMSVLLEMRYGHYFVVFEILQTDVF